MNIHGFKRELHVIFVFIGFMIIEISIVHLEEIKKANVFVLLMMQIVVVDEVRKPDHLGKVCVCQQVNCHE
jgi:hypothetical protein